MRRSISERNASAEIERLTEEARQPGALAAIDHLRRHDQQRQAEEGRVAPGGNGMQVERRRRRRAAPRSCGRRARRGSRRSTPDRWLACASSEKTCDSRRGRRRRAAPNSPYAVPAISARIRRYSSAATRLPHATRDSAEGALTLDDITTELGQSSATGEIRVMSSFDS